MKNLIAICLVLCFVPAAFANVPAWAVQDFSATYEAKVGIAKGQTRLELRRLEDNKFVLESWTELRGLISIFKRGQIYEIAHFDYIDGQIVPHDFERQDNISSEDRNVRVTYDWERAVAAIDYQGAISTVDIESGVSNTLVMQVALMQALSSGERPPWLDVVGHKGRLRFDIRYEGEATLTINSQERPLYRYSHSRRTSDIRTTFWAAPNRDHLPLRAQIVKDKKLKGELTLAPQVLTATRSTD